MPKTGFDRYFEKQMEDPAFADEYAKARAEIDQTDRLMRALDAAREKKGWSKADLAREADMTPEAIRRLFTARSMNPTLLTVTRIATALGYRVELVSERRSTGPGNRRSAAQGGGRKARV
jgi:DNA-binding phage protein